MGEEGSGIERLPADCVAHAISLTTPRDACCSSAVSSAFLSAASSDTVWDRFLPPDCHSILSRALQPVVFSSKRDLFFRLCDSILIDGGKTSFWLERWSGAKCFMLSARQLSIVWGDSPRYWRWASLPDSRFSEVAELINVCWLEIRGKMRTKMLSPKTTYVAYLVLKLADWSRGLGYPPQEACVTIGAHSSTSLVRLQASDTHPPPPSRRNRDITRLGTSSARCRATLPGDSTPQPQPRDDGWMEVELGEFCNDDEGDDDGGEVLVSFMEVKGGHWKKGLIIQGIEIRPQI